MIDIVVNVHVHTFNNLLVCFTPVYVLADVIRF